jgi:hypothetical protein
VATTCYVGLGRRDITPDEPVPLNESGWCDISKGVHSPLFARAVAFGQDDRTAILVSCDVIALSNDLAKALRAAISAAARVPTEFIMVAATQNHASPKILPADETDTKGLDSPALSRWLDRFKAEVVQCAQDAVSGLKPACLGMGRGEVRGIAGNRRPLRADGTAVMTWYRPAPESIVEPGFEDPTLEVVRIADDASGVLRGVLMNFACHPNTLWTTELIASDFPGRACKVLELTLGEQAIPVYFNGLCGNIDPFKYMRVPKNAFTAPEAFEPGAPVHLCLAESLRFGNMLGGEALKVAEGLATEPVTGPIRAASVRFAGQLRPGMSFDPSVEAQAIAVGENLAFVGIPGEPFAEIQRDIKAQSPFRTTFTCGHANGFAGYIPTAEAYRQGGYETGNPWTKFGPGIGEQVREAALEALKKASKG